MNLVGRTTFALLASVALVGASGCGPKNATDVVVIAPAAGQAPLAPYNARDARLRAAREQLAELLGRGVRIEIDAALSEGLRSRFEEQLIAGLEELVRSVRVLKAEHPQVFERASASLERVACVYRVTAEQPSARVDVETRTLTLAQGAPPTSLIPRGFVVEAMLDASIEARAHEFKDAKPASMRSADRRAYFEHLIATRPGYGYLFVHARREQDGDRDLARSADAELVLRVLELHDSIGKSDAALRAEVRRWLLDRPMVLYANWYRRGYRDQLEAIPADAPFRHTERAYMRWLARELPTLTDTEARKIADQFFLHDDQDHAARYPGVDRFAFGVGLIDRWLKAGKPFDPEKDSAYERVFCPRNTFDTRRGAACFSSHSGWLAYASSDPTRLGRLAKLVDQRGDTQLAESLVWALHTTPRGSVKERGMDRGAELLRALGKNGKPYQAAFDRLVVSGQSHFDTAAMKLWTEEPTRRGGLLVFLARTHAHLDRHYGDNYWRRFPESFGGAIDARTYQSYFDYGAPAFAHVAQLWPALGPGFSRVSPMVARFESLVPDTSQPEAAPSRKALTAVIDRLCEDKNHADLGSLHSTLRRRVETRPAEKASLSTLVRDTAPGGCKARLREPAPEEP